MSILVETKNLKKYFKVRSGFLHAVDDVSIAIKEGETLGIVGESGCGKSTLGRTLVHLHEATSGQLFFDEEDITDVSKSKLKNLRQNMQMIFQDPYASLNPRMTVTEIIGEPLKIYNICESNIEYNKIIEEIMDKVGLTKKFARSYPHEMDGGRRQRVGVGRALVLQPKFILCDEPVSALDVSIQAQILNLLQDLQDEMNLTYAFISHDLSVVKHISDEICVMYLGIIVEKCKSEELFKKQYHPYTKALISAIPQPTLKSDRERISLKGEVTSPINIGSGCRFNSRCEYAKDICITSTPLYEEITQGHYAACHFSRDFV